jgi:hypothetical protein
MLRSSIVMCALILSACAASGAGPYDDLLKSAPASTNAICLIDVKGAFASAMAKQENWAENGQPNNRGGLGFVPMGAEYLAIAADVNLNTMSRNFQVGLVKMRNAPTMKEIAAREGGTTDDIAGQNAALSPRDVYFTTLSASEMAAIYPADRQNTARWIRAAKAAKTTQIPPYLKAAADKAGVNTVTIAIDLEDVVDRNLLKLSLPTSPTVAKNKDLDVARLTAFLASIKGLTFAAKVDNSIVASMTWDFGFDPSQFRKTLPSLAIEVLDGLGVTVPSIETWEPTFADTSMTLSGRLTTAELKRIVSLFAFPSVEEAPVDPNAKGNEPYGPATKRYLMAVDSILSDLGKLVDSPYYTRSATWHDKAASQIMHLSRQRVDPAAVDAALQSARKLEMIAGSLRGVPMEVGNLANQAYVYSSPQWSVGWWGWRPSIAIGPSQVQTNLPQVQDAIAKTIADDRKRRDTAWSEINRIMAETRQKMADKYKFTF